MEKSKQSIYGHGNTTGSILVILENLNQLKIRALGFISAKSLLQFFLFVNTPDVRVGTGEKGQLYAENFDLSWNQRNPKSPDPDFHFSRRPQIGILKVPGETKHRSVSRETVSPRQAQ